MPGKSSKKGKKSGKQSKAAQKGPVQTPSNTHRNPQSEMWASEPPLYPQQAPSGAFEAMGRRSTLDPELLGPSRSSFSDQLMLDQMMQMLLGFHDQSSPAQPPLRHFKAPQAQYNEQELLCTSEKCAKCGTTSLPSPVTCTKCNVAVYCSELHKEAHQKDHESACIVLQADAAALSQGAPLTDLVHCGLVRLLFDPDRAVSSLQAVMHAIDGRFGDYTVQDLQGVPNYSTLRSKAQRHMLYRRGTNNDTPLESCKLSATVLLMMCAQLEDRDNGDTNHLQDSAGWLSQSKGAFDNSHLLRPNGPDKKLRRAIEDAVSIMREWSSQQSSTEVSDATRRGVCIAVGVTDCAVFRQPWLPGLAHTFTLILSPVNAPENIDAAAGTTDSSGKESSSLSEAPLVKGATEGEATDRRSAFKFTARLYQAYGPPDIGYSLRTNAYTGGGSKNMSEAEVWDFVNGLERLQSANSWRVAQSDYVKLFGAKPRLEPGYPCELHVRTRLSKFSEETLRCMCRMHAALLEVPYAAIPSKIK